MSYRLGTIMHFYSVRCARRHSIRDSPHQTTVARTTDDFPDLLTNLVMFSCLAARLASSTVSKMRPYRPEAGMLRVTQRIKRPSRLPREA